ncbi:S-layer homology domain-containing protein [Anaerotignum propionicum]|uniref:Endo-1,4-beta-xylanase A n=1 Tax=Anaerotignum propionicum DSM 1682 TaxID=991789 RepID=A0A0X8VB88_ANAPI|nr:S-layer homology domain-containing protein [Anaerotignum propionicum]AMJ39841.1 endo-1,4-beta-xylanase A precursor [Anaerotignum propionicum DSM 1682]SHE27928.1 S-layer homology domain-containing protein [[Clostridium] propionicum DSM 1682] [Anaerotignum propionicum DSM 1682]
MKKKMALALSVVMASSCMSVTGYAANFKDINDVPWDGAKTVINSVADLGLLSGYEDNTFRARNSVTYCEAIQMLYATLQRSGTAKQMDAADHYKYISFLQGYNIPTWAQAAVAYGLENNIITTNDMVKFMSGKTSNFATRQDVAKMFGNALAIRYDIDRSMKVAVAFKDFYRISDDSAILVDLLARLGIVSGDNGNNFNPTNNINRAEMAVMLDKTYNLLKNGVETTGTITEFEDSGSYYKVTIKTDAGTSIDFHAVPNLVKVYNGSGNQELAMSRLNAGDKISFAYNGGSLESIRVLNGSSTQQKYNITGYITALKSGEIRIENENTGATENLTFDGSCVFYIDNKSVRKSELEEKLKDNSDKHAYAGINTKTTVEKDKDSRGNSTQVEKTYVTEIYVTFADEYTRTGVVDKMETNYISYKPTDSSSTNMTYFTSDCKYYIGEKSVSLSDLKSLANSGTVYVKITINKEDKASKVVLSEESFTADSNSSAKIYDVKDLTESQLVVNSGGDKITYKFGSTNSVSNITFYTWDEDDKDWVTVKVSNAESYFDKNDRASKNVFCKIEFNSGGKINRIYVSTKKSAWSTGSESSAERKAEVDSISDNTLKFKNSTVSYTLLNQYNVKINPDKDVDAITGTVNGTLVKYPLTILGAKTSSLTLFRKMVEANDVTVYAEIKADGNNVIQSIEARPTAAKGKLVSYDADKKELVLDCNGKEITFITTRKPSTGTDDYTYEDLETSGYIGSILSLTFNSDGIVIKIAVDENAYEKGKVSIKGIAESAKDGLKFKGKSTVYAWLGRSNIEIHNYSLDSSSLDRVKDAIDDKDITVYAEVRLTEKEQVDRINVYVQDAEGKFEEFNEDKNTVRIITASGNRFTFNTATKPTINISGVASGKWNDLAVGKSVKLTFNSDGLLKSVEG